MLQYYILEVSYATRLSRLMILFASVNLFW